MQQGSLSRLKERPFQALRLQLPALHRLKGWALPGCGHGGRVLLRCLFLALAHTPRGNREGRGRWDLLLRKTEELCCQRGITMSLPTHILPSVALPVAAQEPPRAPGAPDYQTFHLTTKEDLVKDAPGGMASRARSGRPNVARSLTDRME